MNPEDLNAKLAQLTAAGFPSASTLVATGPGTLHDLFHRVLPDASPACIPPAAWPSAEQDVRFGSLEELKGAIASMRLRDLGRLAVQLPWVWHVAWLLWPGQRWPAVFDVQVLDWLVDQVEGTGWLGQNRAKLDQKRELLESLRFGTLSQFTQLGATVTAVAPVAAGALLRGYAVPEPESTGKILWANEEFLPWPKGATRLSSAAATKLLEAKVRRGDHLLLVTESAVIERWGKVLSLDKDSARVRETMLSTPFDAHKKTVPAALEPAPSDLTHLAPKTPATTEVPQDLIRPATELPPTNLILYGPPGTGKTWSTTQEVLRLCGIDLQRIQSDDVRRIWFEALEETGRVGMATFHPAYEYEDFIEGIVPQLGEEGAGTEASGSVSYKRQPGVFKRMSEESQRARFEAMRAEPARAQAVARKKTVAFDEAWEVFEERVGRGLRLHWKDDRYYDLTPYATERDGFWFHAVDKTGEMEILDPVKRISASRDNLEQLWNAVHADGSVLKGDSEDWTYNKLKGVLEKGFNPQAYMLGLRELLAIEESMKGVEEPPESRPLRAVPQFVMVIDEINRGNIPRIFGELLTLLEANKRLGMPEQATVSLARGSRARFGVPKNLHVLGTMNTADRSIAQLDVALRRRFTFRELMPNTELVERLVGTNAGDGELGKLTARMLGTMNRRIVYLLDRDHQLGHAYFLGVKSLDNLRDVFVDQIIPLLQEYFYASWDKIALVLGSSGDESGPPILKRVKISEMEVLGVDAEGYDDRESFELNSAFVSESGANLRPFFERIVSRAGQGA